MRSANSALLCLALALSAIGAPAQELKPEGAREAIGKEGDAALERFREGIAKAKPEPATGPASLPTPSPAIERRAFEGLRRRAPDPSLDGRAKAALEDARVSLERERAAAARRIAQAIGLEAPEESALVGALPKSAPGSWVPVLFVSSSMPLATLRTYAAQLERSGGVLAFRGMPGGMTRMAPMAKLSADILKLAPGCAGASCAMRATEIIVDPLVFRAHGVTRVPALAMVPGDPAQPYCERDEEAPAVPIGTPLVYGDAALSGLLDEFARLGGAKEVRDAQSRLARP